MKTKSIFQKNVFKFFLASLLLVFYVNSNAQCCGGSKSKSCNHSSTSVGNSNTSSIKEGSITETFGVNGNCGMCKTAIEGTLIKQKGIASSDWNQSSKTLTVSFDEKIIKIEKIHQIIADAGYDTDKIKASDKAYNKLPGCCKYDRN
ncbi:MAG: heavy-metal-associated domain-containing protein [Bacteroidia bacterium]|nr:heavy-metal-associated domain-containing protein [Bacteroidia bacterium]